MVADSHAVSEKKPVGSTRGKEVSILAQMIPPFTDQFR